MKNYRKCQYEIELGEDILATMQIVKADSQLDIQFEWFIEIYNLRGISFSSLRIDTILDDITICIIACSRDRKVE
jgi:hypothetical protein